jgi:hypothetical protein
MMGEYDDERKARIHIDEMLTKSGWQIIRRGNSIPTNGTKIEHSTKVYSETEETSQTG